MDVTFTSQEVRVYLIEQSGLKAQTVLCLADIEKLLEKKNPLWIDVVAPLSPELVVSIGNLFKLHESVIDDINHIQDQRPKVELLDHYAFWIFRLYCLSQENQFLLKKMATVLKGNYVLTFRQDREDIEQYSFKLIDKCLSTVSAPKADYFALLLMYLLLEEAYQRIEVMTENLETVEEVLIESPKKIKLPDIYLIKRRILILRKLIDPIIEISTLLFSEKPNFINTKSYRLLRKIKNNALRASEILDLYQQMISYIFDMYLSSTNTLTNKAVTLLTQFSTIFIPISFITGVYGMNFHYMPELELKYAYPLVLGIMAAIAGGMIYFFKKHQEL